MADRARYERRVGSVLNGKWKLESLLGVGGMAAVYVGVHKIGRRDAIKILHAEISGSAELRTRFEREAQAVNSFHHPGAVEIRDIDTTRQGEPFLVMELLSGHSLGDTSRRDGGVEVPKLLHYIDEVLDVLACAHDSGVVHRDIKPDNLFILENGRIKVLDFGLARLLESPAITQSGTRIGTTPYMAPEQVRGRKIDHRVDIFAVGATMFRILARRRVHIAKKEADLLMMMSQEQAPSLASVAPNVPADVALVVDLALQFERNDRYPDALTMQKDIRALLRGDPPPFATDRREQLSKTVEDEAPASSFGFRATVPDGGSPQANTVRGDHNARTSDTEVEAHSSPPITDEISTLRRPTPPVDTLAVPYAPGKQKRSSAQEDSDADPLPKSRAPRAGRLTTLASDDAPTLQSERPPSKKDRAALASPSAPFPPATLWVLVGAAVVGFVLVTWVLTR